MTPRKAIARPIGVRALGEAVELPDSLRRGLVWAPDLSTTMDLVSGRRGTLDGTTYSASTGARSFNGTTDRIDWPNVRDFGTTPRAHSGAMWIRPSSVGAGLFVIWTAANTGPAFSVIFRRSADALEFSHAYDATGLRRVSAAVLTVNTWAHVGWSYTGSGTAAGASLFVGGAEVGSYVTTTNPVGTPRAADGLWSLAGRVESDANNFAGRVRLPMIWDRALSTSEFAVLARIGRPT